MDLRTFWRALTGRWTKMNLDFSDIPATELAVYAEAAGRAGVDLKTWTRANLQAALPPDLRRALEPTNPAQEQAHRQLDEVDLALDALAAADEADPGSVVFGLRPVDPAPPKPPSPSAPMTEGGPHPRVTGGVTFGTLASSPAETTHPCRHYERRYLPGFSHRDSAGTCTCPSRAGGSESVCNWTGSSALGCPFFSSKIRPTPPSPSLPRMG